MTDNDIIKALEKSLKVADETINRQKAKNTELQCKNVELQNELKAIKAEIERLKNDSNVWKDIAHRETNYVAQAKSEAIKEFADRLKEKAYLDGAVSITQELVVDVRDIDDLVEEMAVNYESSKQKKDDESIG